LLLLSCRCKAYEHQLWVMQSARYSGHAVEVCSVSWAESLWLLLHEWQAWHQSSVYTLWLTMQHAVWVSIAVLGVAHVRFVTLNNDDDGNDSNHRDYYYCLCDTVVCLTTLVLSQVSVVPLCRVHYQQFFWHHTPWWNSNGVTLGEGIKYSWGRYHTTQQFYGPFSGTTQVSRCQKRTSGLNGARED